MAQTVVAVFDSHTGAIHGAEGLRQAGFRPDQISIIAPDVREVEGYGEELGVRVLQAGATMAAAGGVLGGASGWLVGLAGLAIPGAGVVLAAGPIVGALLGLVGGASAGGFLGLLVGLGLPRGAAEEYHRELHERRTLVMVDAEGEFALAEVTLQHSHPRAIHRHEEKVFPRGEKQKKDLPPDRTTRASVAAPDQVYSPADVAAAIDGQETGLNTQFREDTELHPLGGRTDT